MSEVLKGTTIPVGRSRIKPEDRLFGVLSTMEVGDATDFPWKDGNSVGAAMGYWGKKYGFVFTRRRINESTVRVWRVK